MDNGPKQHKRHPAPGVPLRVSGLAIEVVAKLAARTAPSERSLRQAMVEKVLAAVISPDPCAFDVLRPELRRARITPALLADVYIPEVARKLGQGWEDDCLSFAEVSIGTARLQAILRDIGAAWCADERTEGGARTVLVLVPEGEQHTLGAMVMISQLRRRGISVCLRFGPSAAEIRALMSGFGFDGVMISVSTVEKVPEVARLVGRIRQSSSGHTLVAAGGVALAEAGDLVARTGVDLATNDLDLVLSRFAELAVPLSIRETA